MSRVVFVAGDPSGDAHAAELIAELRRRDPRLRCSGLGGPAMQKAGMELVRDLTRHAAIGPLDAARQIGGLLAARKALLAHVDAEKPDRAVLVDFGDYNLPFIAPELKRRGIPVTYFISPQLWAWGRFRLRWVRKYVDHMLVFFRFEEAFYREAGVQATWIGHPLIERAKSIKSYAELQRETEWNPWRMTVALLPGSREKEISRHLPLLLEAAQSIAVAMPGVQFLLPKAPGIALEQLVKRAEPAGLDLTITEGPLQDALQLADAAVVASGTATLETALAGKPMVVIYRVSWPTYLLAKPFIRTPHIALVNVVAGKRVVPEFVQDAATPRRIRSAVLGLLRDQKLRAEQETALKEVRAVLGEAGAIKRAADCVLAQLGRRSA